MNEIPGHTSPPFSEDSRDDALFHYTSADGLIGILKNEEIWSTAYYCSNDKSELSAGNGILTPAFLRATQKMIEDNDQMVRIISNRGIDINEHARKFESRIISHALNALCAYITCFCMPTKKEDFSHGILSQWRAYGVDGGYAIQFSRKKLQSAINFVNNEQGLSYEIGNVYYTAENALKSEVLRHTDAFIQAYRDDLNKICSINDILSGKLSINPIENLIGEPLGSLLDYIIQTKNQHFSEERECRLSLIEPISSETPTNYFNRGGMVVPYKKTPEKFRLLECIDGIIIGPNPRMPARFQSVTQMVRAKGLKVNVRPSHIPFTRV